MPVVFSAESGTAVTKECHVFEAFEFGLGGVDPRESRAAVEDGGLQ